MDTLEVVEEPAGGLWKIATTEEAEAWASAGELRGSALDAADGFFHFSDAAMVKSVARLFFKGVAGLTLLHIASPASSLAPTVLWVADDASNEQEAVAPRTVVVRLSPDGCAHVFTPAAAAAGEAPMQPLPWDAVTERFGLPLGTDGESHVFPPEAA